MKCCTSVKIKSIRKKGNGRVIYGGMMLKTTGFEKLDRRHAFSSGGSKSWGNQYHLAQVYLKDSC